MEIKYRGKRVNSGEWVHGYVVYHLVDGDFTRKEKTAYITFDYMDDTGQVYRECYEVDPKTVGQYTGKPDKNGKEIYRGDLIEVKTDKKHFITEIEWDTVSAGFLIKDSDNTYCGLDAITVFKNGSSSYGGCVEVIGNIHEKAGAE